jgi:hypothetical protein
MWTQKRKIEREIGKIEFFFYIGLTLERRACLRSSDPNQASDRTVFFFELNQLGPTKYGLVLAPGPAIASGQRSSLGDAPPQTTSAPRRARLAGRASVATRVTPDPRRSPSWGAGRAGCVFFFYF